MFYVGRFFTGRTVPIFVRSGQSAPTERGEQQLFLSHLTASTPYCNLKMEAAYFYETLVAADNAAQSYNRHECSRNFDYCFVGYSTTFPASKNTGLFISPSGNSELDCATTKTDTAERSISIGRESLQDFFVLGALPYFQVPPLGDSREEKWRSQ